MLKDRLMFVDIVRGSAIIGVILVHSSVYGIWYNEPNALKVLPTAAVAALSPLILLATWAGAFALITGLVNAYNITRRVDKGRSPGRACAAPAVNAGVLMVIWIAVALLFTHRRHGIFGGGEVFSLISGSLALGRFTLPDLQTLFYKDALVMISLSGFTSALAMRLILRNMDVSNQSHLRRAVSILFAWGAVFLIASAFLQGPLFSLFIRTVWIRRFGMISLSVFILENPLTAVLGRIFHSAFGDPQAPIDAFMTNAFAIILYFTVSLSLWFIIVRIWEKAGFKYSFEWLSINVGALFRKDASNRLDVSRILYGES